MAMVHIEEDAFNKMKKDADDNRQIIRIVRYAVLLIVFLFIFFSWGCQMVNLDIQRRQSELQCQMAIERAENNVEIKEIESDGMSFDDYIRWLNAREKD